MSISKKKGQFYEPRTEGLRK